MSIDSRILPIIRFLPFAVLSYTRALASPQRKKEKIESDDDHNSSLPPHNGIGTKAERRAASKRSGGGGGGGRFPRISGAPTNDSVGTPDSLFASLDEIFHFTYDPCPLNGLQLPDVPNGLSTPWGYTTFVNPPYSEIAPWLSLAVNNMALYGTRSVILIPAHVETLYWDQLVTRWASEVWYCITGLQFKGYDSKFSLPMCLLLFGQFDDVLPLDRPNGARVHLGENYWFISRLPRGDQHVRLRRADARSRQQETAVVK